MSVAQPRVFIKFNRKERVAYALGGVDIEPEDRLVVFHGTVLVLRQHDEPHWLTLIPLSVTAEVYFLDYDITYHLIRANRQFTPLLAYHMTNVDFDKYVLLGNNERYKTKARKLIEEAKVRDVTEMREYLNKHLSPPAPTTRDIVVIKACEENNGKRIHKTLKFSL